MRMTKKTSWLFAIWALAVVFIGGVLMSYHQPFQTPSSRILALGGQSGAHRWTALHLLSSGCGCSQRVMLHLLQRRPFDGIAEQVVLIDGDEPSLPETTTLLARLTQEGFSVVHKAAKDIPQNIGLHGVPLLVFASSEDKILYMGGYGVHSDQDSNILQQIRSGNSPKPIAVLGCAIGARLQREVDPFHLKY